MFGKPTSSLLSDGKFQNPIAMSPSGVASKPGMWLGVPKLNAGNGNQVSNGSKLISPRPLIKNPEGTSFNISQSGASIVLRSPNSGFSQF